MYFYVASVKKQPRVCYLIWWTVPADAQPAFACSPWKISLVFRKYFFTGGIICEEQVYADRSTAAGVFLEHDIRR